MVLPVHDRNPTHRRPVVTYLLILASFVVFLLEPVALPDLGGATPIEQACEQEGFFREHAAIPEELLRGEQLDAVGPAVGEDACALVPPDYEKAPLVSALKSIFLHGGWLHLLGNMLFLFVFGNNVEDRFGRLRFLLFYLGAGVAATYAFALTEPSSVTPVVGASGAIAAVLGAYLIMFPRARVISLVPFFFFIPLPLPAWLVLGLWFVLQGFYTAGAAVTESAGVAYVAHVAGFVVGAGLVLFLQRTLGRPLHRPGHRRRQRQARRGHRGRW